MASNPSVLSKINLDKPYETHGLAIPLISIILVLAAIALVITIIRFRFLGQSNLAEDILLAALALSLATAGVALSALANGMRTKLMLEAANIEAQYINATGTVELRQKLIAAIHDRLGSIVISPATCPLDATTNKTAQLTWKCEDKSGLAFVPDEEIVKLTWYSSDTAVAKVDDNGLVTRVSTGSANVTASFKGFRSSVCVVTCT
jgi:hypothetical protein